MAFTKVSDLKIFPHIDPSFDDLHSNSLDFKRHLKGNIALNKESCMLPNGRPSCSEYYLNGVLMAKIYFTFESDEDTNLVTDRREELVYIKNDETETPKALIKHKEYDPDLLTDGILVMEERVRSRQNILEGLKTFLAGYLQAAIVQDLDYIINLIDPYWEAYDYKIGSFVRTGHSAWRDSLLADDLSAYSTWIDLPVVDGQGNPVAATVKQYMINTLTY